MACKFENNKNPISNNKSPQVSTVQFVDLQYIQAEKASTKKSCFILQNSAICKEVSVFRPSPISTQPSHQISINFTAREYVFTLKLMQF